LFSREFLDKDIVGSDGWKIGKSKELICDRNSWQIVQLDVELNEKIEDEIGESVPLRHHHVPIDTSLVLGIGDVITLKITRDEVIKILSTYSKTARQSGLETDSKKGPISV
jgi:sporulation protein YlmC with PRC-barrel domain